jgi:hypothetical protein
VKELAFQDDGRTFTCHAASSPATPGTMWWWVSISGETQRYAAFRTEAGDNPTSLKRRVIAYYAQLLADRARPREIRTSWGRPRKPVATEPAESETE